MTVRSCAAILLSFGLGACTVRAPRPPAPPQPPAPTTYSVVVRVYEGAINETAAGHKATGVTVTIAGNQVITDGSGNVTIDGLAAGTYEACTEERGWKRACASGAVPGPAIAIALERDVPPVLPIHVDGKVFRDSAGAIWPWRGVTAFTLLQRVAQGQDVGPYLDARRTAGANLVRVLSTMRNITDFPPTAYTDAQLGALLAAAHARGLRVELVALADAQTWPLDAQRRQVQRIIDAVAAAGAIDVVEVCNECFKNAAAPQDIMRGVTRRPGVLMAAGGDNATCDNLAPFLLDYITLHNERKDEWPRTAKDELELRDGFGCGDGRPGYGGAHVPVVSDEPMGADEVDQPGKRAARADDFFWFGATAQLLGAGATFHSSAGITTTDPGPVTAAAERAFFAGMDAIPIAAQLGLYTRGLLTTCPLEHDDARALRTFCSLRGGEATCVVIRPTPAWTAAARDGWRIVSSAGPRGSVLEVRR